MKRTQTAFLKLCLADALIKLMAAQDYNSINVNTICELAGVGRTTFYRHLDCKNSKEELNRRLFSLLYNNGLIMVIMRACELLVSNGEAWDKALSYLMSYFIYGYFGVIYQWIKYGFDETPEQVQKHISDAGTKCRSFIHS